MTLYVTDPDAEYCEELSGQLIVVDGANVAYTNHSHDQMPVLSNLKLIEQFFEINGISDFLVLIDRSLHYKIDEPKKYSDLIKKDTRYFETPGGTQADHFILQHAYKTNGFIVSNDNFRDFYAIYDKDWIIAHKMSFCIINNEIFLDKLICK